MLQKAKYIGNVVILLTAALSLRGAEQISKKRKLPLQLCQQYGVHPVKQHQGLEDGRAKLPPCEKIMFDEERDVIKKMLTIFPAPLAGLVADFVYGEEAVRFVPYVDMRNGRYQRGKGYLFLSIMGGDKTGRFPIVYDGDFTIGPRSSVVGFPDCWNLKRIEENLKNVLTLGVKNNESLRIHEPLKSVMSKAPVLIRETVSILLALSESSVFLSTQDTEEVALAQSNSRICMIPNMTFRNFAQIWQNTVFYLHDARLRLPGNRFACGNTESINKQLDGLVDRYEKHIGWIKEILGDETGKKVPVFYSGGTPEECFEHLRRSKSRVCYPRN